MGNFRFSINVEKTFFAINCRQYESLMEKFCPDITVEEIGFYGKSNVHGQ